MGQQRMSQKQSARNCAGRLRDVRRRYQAWAAYLLGHRFGEDRLAMLRLQVPVGKAQNLKTAGITDDPEIQLLPFPVSGRNLTKRAKPACFSTVRSTPGFQLPDPGRKAVRGAFPFQYAISTGWRGSRMS